VKNQQRIDNNQVAYLPSINVNRWLALRLEIVGVSLFHLQRGLSEELSLFKVQLSS
jgi:ATP-binding cassette, subfamily C (CFTR/MRP), member 1